VTYKWKVWLQLYGELLVGERMTE